MNDNNPAEDQSLRNLFTDAATAFPPPDGLKEKIHAQMTTATGERSVRAGRAPTRRLWKWLVPAAAAAACLAIVATVGFWPRQPVLVQSAYAELARAIEETNKAEWVHVTDVRPDGKVDGEEWWSFKPRGYGCKLSDGRCEYRDNERGEEASYNPATGNVTVKDGDVGEAFPVDGRKSYIEYIMKGIVLPNSEVQGCRLVTNKETVDGIPCLVYSLHNEEDKEWLRMVVDAAQDRVVRIWTPNRTQEVDYPVTGPESIYDLPVPRQAAVVDARIRDGQVWEMIKKAARARDGFENNLYAVCYSGTLDDNGRARGTGLYVWYQKGEKERLDNFFQSHGSYAGLDGLSGEDLGALELWLRSNRPTSVAIADRYRLGSYYDLTVPEPIKGQVRLNSFGMGPWRFMDSCPGKSLPPIDGPNGPLFGAAGTGPEEGSNGKKEGRVWKKRAVYLNPARDYLAEREQEETASGDEPWVPESARAALKAFWAAGASDDNHAVPSKRTTTILEYAQTPAGHWYPRKTLTEIEENGKLTKMVLIYYVDTTRGIPDEVFDCKKFEAQLGRPIKVKD